MIGKVYLRKDFYGAVNYVLSKPQAVLLEASGVRSESVSAASQDFELIRSLRPRVRMAVWHASISFANADVVSDELIKNVTDDYLKEMGLSDSQYMIVRHFDTLHHHFHIIANRIKDSGELVSDQWCKNRTARCCDRLEEKYRLTIARLQLRKSNAKDKRARLSDKKAFVKQTIDSEVNTKKVSTLDDLKISLQRNQIEMQLHIQKTGRVNGVSFRYKDSAFKGSALGKEYKVKELTDRIDKNLRPKLKHKIGL
ncbi:MAG: relaxase/mobilization nuclease domain-containing protein [Cyclobacteriaceae bacterium]|nr:relaxase/mobilization nuclease domain-containing protein [Cyclobacteriaceae bacterium]